PVDGVVLVRTGSTDSAATDGSGAYDLTVGSAGAWTLVPNKTGAGTEALSSLDAAYALQAAVGMRSLDPVQALACDVTGNGAVSRLDAARILEVVVGKPVQFRVAQACGSTWLFLPDVQQSAVEQPVAPQVGIATCSPGAISFSAATDMTTGQDFHAV